MTTIFLAASKELEADRRVFEQDILRRNQIWGKRGYQFSIDVWEDFDDAMSATRKQDDYNAAIRAADLFVVLVHTKVGKYTREEFEAAWAQFSNSPRQGNSRTGKPRIYAYFKCVPEPGDPEPGPEYATVRAFLHRLAELGHWPNKYDEPSQLLHHFGTQLERMWADGIIQPSEPSAGKESVAPTNQAAAQGSRSAFVGKDNKGPINTGRQAVHTKGGAVIFGSVQTEGGDFIGRDHRKAVRKTNTVGRAPRKR
jgi:hypothetical protein